MMAVAKGRRSSASTALAAEKRRRQQRRDELKECAMHSWMKHGKEAEELRTGVEKLLKEYRDTGPFFEGEEIRDLIEDLQNLLDDTDARDSLAYLERNPRTTHPEVK